MDDRVKAIPDRVLRARKNTRQVETPEKTGK